MNGYHQQQPYEGYSQPPPHHPSQIPRNMIAAKPQHPYSSYYNGGEEYMYAPGGSPLRQGPPPELNPYMQGQPARTQMNPNAAVFMPRQYEMPANVSRAPPQQAFNPFGYNNHRHYTPQRIPPPTMQHPQQQQPPQSLQYQPQQVQQQPQQSALGYGGSSSFSTLRMSLAEQKQQSEEQLKRQQRDQEEYASRFLAAVQERVQRPSSASAAQNNQQQSSNNGQQSMNGTSLQNLAMMLQQEGLSSASGGYFDQDINSYDFEAQHNANPPFQLSQELMDKIAGLPNKMSLYEVQIGLEQILAEPTEFDAWIVAVRDRLASKEITSDDLEAAAWLAIEIAIYSEDSQYVFARVCTYLYERLSSFKEPLLKIIRDFHHIHDGFPVDISQNLLVFMAELYVQAFAPVGIRNHQIPTTLYEQFSTILKSDQIDDALLKKVVSTLKLCGRHLETDIGEKCMGELIKKLEDFTKEGTRPKNLTDSVASPITNLIAYRSAGWGGNETSNNTTSATSAPIRFAPENNMDLTEEEIKFLESNGAIESGSSYSSGPSSNDIYDAEILEDYEKFLRDHAEQTAISAAEKALERLSMEEEDDYSYDNQDPLRDDNSTPTPHSKQ